VFALTYGNGCLNYSSTTPIPTEPFTFSEPVVSCKFVDLGDKVYSLERHSVSKSEWDWASFNIGVGEGLKTLESKSVTSGIDNAWILLNRAAQSESQHAGFVFGLGLNGHLKSLVKWLPFSYLNQMQDFVSIGLVCFKINNE
jgi:anaphase-promoting complex subunit 1